MMTEMFTVFDSAADAFLEPFFAPTVEVAIRMFRTLVNREDHQFHVYPEDYTLFHIGTFDGSRGLVDSLATPHSIGLAQTFLDRGPSAGGE